MISVGMSTGAICNFVMELESRNYMDDEDMKMSGASDTGAHAHNPIAKLSIKEQKSFLSNEGNMLASKSYITSVMDTPVLDPSNGTWTMDSDELFGKARTQDARPSVNSLTKFTLTTHSYPNIHRKVKGMVVDQQRCLLYSTGSEGFIHG